MVQVFARASLAELSAASCGGEFVQSLGEVVRKPEGNERCGGHAYNSPTGNRCLWWMPPKTV